MIAVVDTSVLVGLVTLNVEDLRPELIQRLGALTPHVPDIIDVEFHRALRGLTLGKKITTERAEHARGLFSPSSRPTSGKQRQAAIKRTLRSSERDKNKAHVNNVDLCM